MNELRTQGTELYMLDPDASAGNEVLKIGNITGYGDFGKQANDITTTNLDSTAVEKISGLPEAFYDLQGRGMALFALVLAGILIVIFGLSTRSRLQSLALGCALMHFGEAAAASTAPHLWAEMFSPEYVAEVSGAIAGADTAANG